MYVIGLNVVFLFMSNKIKPVVCNEFYMPEPSHILVGVGLHNLESSNQVERPESSNQSNALAT